MTPRQQEMIAVYNDLATYPAIKDAAAAIGIEEKTLKDSISGLRKKYPDKIVSRIREARVGREGFNAILPGFELTKASEEQDGEGITQKLWVTQKPVSDGGVKAVPEGHEIEGVSTLYMDGVQRGQWVKTGKAKGQAYNIIDAAKQVFEKYRGTSIVTPPPQYTDDNLLTVYPLADLHLGMHSWGRETGENYDLKIAVKRCRQVVSQLISRAQPSKECLILNLGDFFHMNDQKNATPRSGNVLDVDGRWPKVLHTGVQLTIDMIEMALQRHETVRYAAVHGNHDPDATDALRVALMFRYENNPRVIIEDGPSGIYYQRFGKVLLGATHGHNMKPDRMVVSMATDRREDWGATLFKAIYFGHIHHETAVEIGDVRVESFNTIAAKDAHAHNGGWRSGQAISAITYHSEFGEVGRHRVNLIRELEAA